MGKVFLECLYFLISEKFEPLYPLQKCPETKTSPEPKMGPKPKPGAEPEYGSRNGTSSRTEYGSRNGIGSKTGTGFLLPGYLSTRIPGLIFDGY